MTRLHRILAASAALLGSSLWLARAPSAAVAQSAAPAPAALAAPAAPGGEIVIPPSGVAQVPIAVPVPVASDPATARLVAKVCAGDLAESGYFKIIDPKAFLANLDAEGLGIVALDWTNVGAQGVVKGQAVVRGGSVELKLRFYEPVRGTTPVLARDYIGSAAQVRGFVHQFDNELVKLLSGVDGFFGTKIAFVAGDSSHKEIYLMDSDGADAHAVTNYGTLSILPVWAPSGGLLAFTSYLRGNPDLYVIGPAGGRPRRISHFDGMNTPGSFSPDGGRLAVTLSKGGPINIYTMTPSGGALTRVTTSPAPIIDTSPQFSPDGSEIAFVSNRDGSPQIFLMSATGGPASRVTFAGKYNTEPTWCPRRDVSLLAYTARDEKGAFDLFTVNVQTGELVRLTEGQGDNDGPTWAPNGRVLAFHSSRGGIWTMSADGSNQRQITGFGYSPRWAPAGKRP